jgi:hypothetical protein
MDRYVDVFGGMCLGCTLEESRLMTGHKRGFHHRVWFSILLA